MKKLNNTIKTFSLVVLMVISITGKAQLVRTANAENRVAILPMTYVGEGNAVKMDEMRYRLQNVAYEYLRNEAMELKFQDPAETNALLYKKGVDENSIRRFTPRELAEILEVEYVLVGMVIQEHVAVMTYRNSTKEQYTDRRGRVEWERRGNTRTVEDINTNIDLGIYNDKGEKIFSKSRRSILTTNDAYKNGIQYLLKRSPLYKR